MYFDKMSTWLKLTLLSFLAINAALAYPRLKAPTVRVRINQFEKNVFKELQIYLIAEPKIRSHDESLSRKFFQELQIDLPN